MVPNAIFAVINKKHTHKNVRKYFIEGRFFLVLLAYNARSICPRQNASAAVYIVPQT